MNRTGCFRIDHSSLVWWFKEQPYNGLKNKHRQFMLLEKKKNAVNYRKKNIYKKEISKVR